MGSVCHSCLFVASLFSLNAIIRLRLFQTGVIFSFNHPGSLSWIWSSRSHDKVKWPIVKEKLLWKLCTRLILLNVAFLFPCPSTHTIITVTVRKCDQLAPRSVTCVLDLYSTTVTPQTPSLQKPHSITILSKGKFLNMKPPTLQLALCALEADKNNICFITPKNIRPVSSEV